MIDRVLGGKNQAMIEKTKNAELARRIATAIAESGMSAKSIAAAVGVTPQAVTGWKNTGSIAKDTLVRFAQAVGKQPLYFIDVNEPTTSLPPAPKQAALTAMTDLEKMTLLMSLFSRVEPALRPRIFVAVRDLIIDLGGLDVSDDGTAANNQGK